MKLQTRVCTDVGGTFTDLVYFETGADGRQTVRTAKSDTTPPNFEHGILEAMRKGQVPVAELGSFAHGTTVVINALTERRGAKTALITTKGFRDVLEIARGARPDFYNARYAKPAPFVPRHLRRELSGRMDASGRELQALALDELPALLDDFKAQDVQALAVCFLHAYGNPAHEQQVAARIKTLWPEVTVVASHEITREWREYERTNTTVLSAYVQPVTSRYLGRLERELQSSGYHGPIYVMQSNCGVDTLAHAKEVPISMVESGPASGMWGAAVVGRLIGEPNVIALDIGGTTAKCSLIKDGEVQVKTDYYIERSRLSAGYPLMVPVVDLVEIGNGGGSIAWVNERGRLNVGPRSAGAAPGPAAYGRGGLDATTTDANLYLGRINPDYFCGGAMPADMDAVNKAIGALAQRLDKDPAAVALGIVEIADANMVNALKLISINRGFDPRDFVLVAFGGGGGMHAVSLAQELGVKRVVVPQAAGVFSAWGMVMSDLRRDFFLTRLLPFDSARSAVQAEDLLAELVAQGRSGYEQEGIAAADIETSCFVKLRYQNQEHALEVKVAPGEQLAQACTQITQRFHDQYEQQYTYRLQTPVELIGVHVVAYARIGKLTPVPAALSDRPASDAHKGRRQVDYGRSGLHEADIYDSTRLLPGMHFTGPAVIEDPGTTTVIFPGNTVFIDAYGNTLIDHLNGGGQHVQ
jgi:N-methylhydantoinase A